jgi:hypothetical protein
MVALSSAMSTIQIGSKMFNELRDHRLLVDRLPVLVQMEDVNGLESSNDTN